MHPLFMNQLVCDRQCDLYCDARAANGPAHLERSRLGQVFRRLLSSQPRRLSR